MQLIKLFKYELIKVLVFLFIFLFSLFFVLSVQGSYYDNENYDNGSINKTNIIRNVNEQKLIKN